MSGWEWSSEDELELARGAYSETDVKHPDYPAAVVDYVDAERKREKEEGPMELEVAPDEIILFTGNPAERMRQMQETAQILAEPVRQRHTVTISGREHVRVEGWTMLGALLGVHPYLVWSRPIPDDPPGSVPIGWEARVEARTIDGRVVGSAEAMCSALEANWKNRDEFALRSMAQTRATSKALRQPLGFVITLAGFDPTPAEEMPTEGSPFREPDLARDKRLRRSYPRPPATASRPGAALSALRGRPPRAGTPKLLAFPPGRSARLRGWLRTCRR